MYQCTIEDNAALDFDGKSIGACEGNVIVTDTDINGNSKGNRPWWHYAILALLVLAIMILLILVICFGCALINSLRRRRERVYSGYEALGPIDPDAPDLMMIVHERLEAERADDSIQSSSQVRNAQSYDQSQA